MSKQAERNAEKMSEVRTLTGPELEEIRLMSQIAVSFAFVAQKIKNNTARFNRKRPWWQFWVPKGRGIVFAQDFIVLADILSNEKDEFVSRKLRFLGYKPGENVTLNLADGTIQHVDEP